MPPPTFRPLAVRLTRTILAWSLLATLTIGGLTGWHERRAVHAQLQVMLQQQAVALSTAAAEAVWEVSPHLVQPQLEAALTWPGVAYVAVSERGAPERIFSDSGNVSMRNSAADIRLPVTSPSRPRELGELRIVIDRTTLDAAALRAAFAAIASSLVLTSVVLVIVLVTLRRRLQRPMQQLSSFLERLDERQLEARLVLQRPAAHGQDEIDLVAARFTALQDRIAGHVRDLDARVAERTEQLQMALDKLKVLAITDPLTGCHNRLAFSQKYPEALAHAERYGRPLSLVFCDVDRFKSINDSHGHPVGDQVLTAMGRCLRDALRASSDWVARYGGEEFVLVLPETPLSQAQDVAERLRQQIEQTLVVALPDGSALRVTASLGVAEYRQGERGEELLTRADEQLYAAKQAGRNQIQPPLAVTA